ncbi:transcriptional repressor [Paenibacillus albidus]|uniref:Transcriptional repressor n=1 Tax=Paenibacillus albidus TaxID=2041023 RepID=A0A917FJ29_9BACL|nr:transcriptional repressor [Paenibacillus albidus]MBT2288204.1 transcriptional repressor [Paenibacillus albidus]GGF86873.1 transcriptional repressor [Paenibacillus albidus]
MRNLNLTSQRQAVYDIVRNSPDHPTAAEVMNRLVEQGHNLAYGTVYNSLRYLSDKKLIQELKLGEAASRYDARMDDHQHIMCEVCGTVDEVMSQVPQDWIDAVAKETGYEIGHAHVVFGGICPDCQSKRRMN